MDKIRLIHDTIGHTLTVWLDDPQKEVISEDTAEEVVLMKDARGRVIGVELLNFHPKAKGKALKVETLVRSEA